MRIPLLVGCCMLVIGASACTDGIESRNAARDEAINKARQELAQSQPVNKPVSWSSELSSEENTHLGYCVEFCAKCGDSRGENTSPPRDEPVRVNFNFSNVEFNTSDDADMSILDFEMVGQWSNRERLRTHMTMDHRSQNDFPLVDVGLCVLHVKPLLSEVIETAVRQRGQNDYKTYGAYVVTVTDPQGELIGEFPLDGLGDTRDLQFDNDPSGKYRIDRTWNRDTDEWRFDIRRMEQFREKQLDAPLMFGMVFKTEGTLTHEDFGPDNSRHEYRFPAAGVDIYTPEAIHAAQQEAFARQQAEREVEFYSAAADPWMPAFVYNGAGSPSIGGGCGGGG